jgi:hypothetical protein
MTCAGLSTESTLDWVGILTVGNEFDLFWVKLGILGIVLISFLIEFMTLGMGTDSVLYDLGIGSDGFWEKKEVMGIEFGIFWVLLQELGCTSSWLVLLVCIVDKAIRGVEENLSKREQVAFCNFSGVDDLSVCERVSFSIFTRWAVKRLQKWDTNVKYYKPGTRYIYFFRRSLIRDPW